MERHPYFDLWLLTTPELCDYLSIDMVERTTIHDWPLSCVQLLTLADDSKRIYKAQQKAISVETDFYIAVQNHPYHHGEDILRYLPQIQVIGTYQNTTGMLLEYIEAPRLDELDLQEDEIIQHGESIRGILHRFPPDLPVITDIGSESKWHSYVGETLSMLNTLVAQKVFRQTNLRDVERLRSWAEVDSTGQTFQLPPVLNHGDLTGENVFVAQQGYKIIDWQRPIRGPEGLDIVKYLYNMGLEPKKFSSRVMNEINWFIHLRWFVECKMQWFPPGESYDAQVAELTHLILGKP